MTFWIPTTKSLPRHGLLVEIKFANGKTAQARIVDNEYDESVWRTTNGKIAHFANNSPAQMRRWQIKTRPDLSAPVAWRKIKH